MNVRMFTASSEINSSNRNISNLQYCLNTQASCKLLQVHACFWCLNKMITVSSLYKIIAQKYIFIITGTLCTLNVNSHIQDAIMQYATFSLLWVRAISHLRQKRNKNQSYQTKKNNMHCFHFWQAFHIHMNRIHWRNQIKCMYNLAH